MATASPSPSVLQEFTCSICLEYFKDPHTLLPCNHIYCKACLMQLRNSDINHCPQCRCETTGFCPDNFIAQKMKTTEILCRICNRMMQAVEVNEHMAQCTSEQDDFQGISDGTEESSSQEILFRCPFCRKDDIKTFEMLQHCVQYHNNDKRKVVCPICASMPWGDASLKSSHFISHLQLRHRYNYENYAELWELDEDAVLKQAVIQSLGVEHEATEDEDINQAIIESLGFETGPPNVSPSCSLREQCDSDFPQEFIELSDAQTEVDACGCANPDEFDEDEALFQAVRESLTTPYRQLTDDEDDALFHAVRESLSTPYRQLTNDEDDALFHAVRESLSTPYRQLTNSGDAPSEIDDLSRALSESLALQRASSSVADCQTQTDVRDFVIDEAHPNSVQTQTDVHDSVIDEANSNSVQIQTAEENTAESEECIKESCSTQTDLE